jgi:hypothetical protein
MASHGTENASRYHSSMAARVPRGAGVRHGERLDERAGLGEEAGDRAGVATVEVGGVEPDDLLGRELGRLGRRVDVPHLEAVAARRPP